MIAPGVPHALARWRTRHYRDIRYDLKLEIVSAPVAALAPARAGASAAPESGPGDQAGSVPAALRGEVEIRFHFRGARQDIVLDWRPDAGGTLSQQVELNGRMVEARFEHEHLIVPRALARAGENVLRLPVQAPIRASGTAVTRYADREDGSHYVYTLFVPSDASSVFPCFDQPDLKARFTLDLAAPRGWKAIGNGALVSRSEGAVSQVPALTRHRFARTEPISTYLFAFAAGPFVAIEETSAAGPAVPLMPTALPLATLPFTPPLTPPLTRLYVRKSRLERASREATEVLRINREALAWFARYFGHAYPFFKYDLVLIPEFAYGGMEHAGASFLREESVLFPSDPSDYDHMRRANLIFHEASHQWFGNLVTMRWFDDLWLKEGFANYMAAKATAALLPRYPAWNAFLALKAGAYRTDVTRGTTAIYQPIPNLASAKSAYGNIVYSKAPAILKQAAFFLGEDVFEQALREFVHRHAFGAAQWSDLVRAFERASGRDLKRWADAWVKRRGMPAVRLAWRPDRLGAVATLSLAQHDVLGEGGVWPMRVKVVAQSLFDDKQGDDKYGDDKQGDDKQGDDKQGYEKRGNHKRGGETRTADITLSGKSVRVPGMTGMVPQFLFANAGDHGYGQFLLDWRSRQAVLDQPRIARDDLLRALLLDALWEAVRETELAPADYIAMVTRHAPHETDEITLASLLARAQVALTRYVPQSARHSLAPPFEAMLAEQLAAGISTGKRITFLRAWMDSGWSEASRGELKRLVQGGVAVPDITLRSRDRFRIIRTLLIRGDRDAAALLERQAAADVSDEGRRYAYGSAAAAADAATKQRYFERFLGDPQLPESWIEEALGPFNAVEQAPLTRAFLEPALAAIASLKRQRKIFFVNNWLAAFIGGQTDAAALAAIERFAANPALDPDLRLKVLEAIDSVERTVRIRARY